MNLCARNNRHRRRSRRVPSGSSCPCAGALESLDPFRPAATLLSGRCSNSSRLPSLSSGVEEWPRSSAEPGVSMMQCPVFPGRSRFRDCVRSHRQNFHLRYRLSGPRPRHLLLRSTNCSQREPAAGKRNWAGLPQHMRFAVATLYRCLKMVSLLPHRARRPEGARTGRHLVTGRIDVGPMRRWGGSSRRLLGRVRHLVIERTKVLQRWKNQI